MTGSLQIKSDHYFIVLNFKGPDGKFKTKWIKTGLLAKGNKRKAEQLLRNALKEYEGSEALLTAPKILFTDYMQRWLDRKKEQVELSTWESYSVYVGKHIIPYFLQLNLTLDQIKPAHISDYYDYKLKSGRCDKKPGGLSPRTVRSHSLIIKEVLEDAVIRELIPRNPARHVPIPKRERKEQKGVFLDAKQANRVLEAFRKHHLQSLVYVTLYYGLRRSEVLGLRWSSIDFENNTLRIEHTVVKNLTVVEKDTTKTASSNRIYALLPEVRELLLELKEKREENRALFGNTFQESDYVFTWPDGRRYHPQCITDTFQKVLREHGLPHMRFHDLRHSTASILYDKGWSLKDIQIWLGHADIETTGNIYTHISNLRRNTLARDLENTFQL